MVYTPSEYKDLLVFNPNLSKHISTKSSKKAKSYSVDWRNKGVINNIKYQGDCSSDWDFSAVLTIESANTIKGDQKVIVLYALLELQGKAIKCKFKEEWFRYLNKDIENGY